jgi:glycosyltransferase involved in cell wall biosynthesis
MAGGIRVLAIYAERLHRRGHQVIVVSLPPPRRSFWSKFKSLLLGRGWPVEPAPEPSYFDGLAVPHRVIERVRPIVDSDLPDADVVLATFWRTGPWVAGLSPSKGAKAIFLQGYETSPGIEDPEIDAVWRLPLRKIVISQWMIDLARRRFGDDDVLHVPNSVDHEQFYAPVRGKQTVPTVGLLYATIHLKGVDLSLAALRRIRERFSNLRVIVFGAEPVAPGLPLPDGAEFYYRPPQQRIRELYAACDVWLCGSRREGFHLPPLEAMACRCPVVSTRVGGPLDIVVDGVNGFLVDIDDAESLAARVVEVLSANEDHWRSMSDAALATACRYSWDAATDCLEAALRHVIEDAGVTGAIFQE